MMEPNSARAYAESVLARGANLEEKNLEVQIAWGLDPDDIALQMGKNDFWKPWLLKPPHPKAIFEDSSNRLETPEHVRFLLATGEELASKTTLGKEDPLFLPKSIRCGIRNLFYRGEDDSDLITKRKNENGNNVYLANDYYDVDKTTLFGRNFDYTTEEVPQNDDADLSDTGTFVAEVVNRLQDPRFAGRSKCTYGKCFASFSPVYVAKAGDWSKGSPGTATQPKATAGAPAAATPSYTIKWDTDYWKSTYFLGYAINFQVGYVDPISYANAERIVVEMNDAINAINAKAPKGMGKAVLLFPQGEEAYIFNKHLRETFFDSLWMMIPLCFTMLLLATMNVFSTFLAVFTVFSVLVQVIGTLE